MHYPEDIGLLAGHNGLIWESCSWREVSRYIIPKL